MMRSAFVESMAASLGIKVTPNAAQDIAFRLDERLMSIIQVRTS